MLIEKIPALYGKALLEAADGAGVLDDVAEEVSFFSGLLAEDAELELFIESPSIESSHKSAVFEKTFRGKATDTFLNFLLLLVDKGREAELKGILAAFGAFHGLPRPSASSGYSPPLTSSESLPPTSTAILVY